MTQFSNRGQDWVVFSNIALNHIENYTIKQYGDKGVDLATEMSADDCIRQVKKYLARRGKNQREGQDQLDLIKAAHYIQMAFTMEDEDLKQ
ncbi:MAG TPA: hypothetical protein VK141_02940 [Nitrosomonas sp.]|nr:hypothetical protein [Nitrosomonas sp.]